MDIQRLDLFMDARLSTRERVLDRLAALLFEADDVLGILHEERARELRWIETHVQRAYDEVNEVMKALCD